MASYVSQVIMEWLMLMSVCITGKHFSKILWHRCDFTSGADVLYPPACEMELSCFLSVRPSVSDLA